LSDGGDLEVKRCAKCAAWIPVSATMCAYCNTSSPDEPLARRRGSVLSVRHGFRVTTLLIVVNAAYFVFSLFVQYRITPNGNPARWALTGAGLAEGLFLPGDYNHAAVFQQHQWWRVLCATFLHVGGIHIALNMLALKQLGELAEELFGPAKLLTVYVVSGVCSSLAVSVWFVGVRHLPPGNVPGLAGASGAIFGVAGLLVAYLLRAGTSQGRAVAMSIARSVLFMLAVGLFVPMISQAGHVGGLLPGLLFGLSLRGEFGNRLKPATRAVWTCAALVCVAAVAASLLAGAWYAFQHMGGP
jgi:rhomboid protease GluP